MGKVIKYLPAQETKTECVKIIIEAATCRPHCLPPGQHSTTLRGLPEPLDSSVGKEPRAELQCPHYYRLLLGSLHSRLIPQGLQGNLWGFTTGNRIVMQKARGPFHNQHLANRVPTCSTQTAVPTGSFVHQQSWDTGVGWPGHLMRYRFARFGSSKNLVSPAACPAPFLPGRVSQAWLVAEYSSCPAWPKGWPEHLEAAWPNTWAESQLIDGRAKPAVFIHLGYG